MVKMLLRPFPKGDQSPEAGTPAPIPARAEALQAHAIRTGTIRAAADNLALADAMGRIEHAKMINALRPKLPAEHDELDPGVINISGAEGFESAHSRARQEHAQGIEEGRAMQAAMNAHSSDQVARQHTTKTEAPVL